MLTSAPPQMPTATTSRSQLQCPATVSIVGSLAAQEVIKACSHVHTPLSQMLVLEALDALTDSELLTETDTDTVKSARPEAEAESEKKGETKVNPETKVEVPTDGESVAGTRSSSTASGSGDL